MPSFVLGTEFEKGLRLEGSHGLAIETARGLPGVGCVWCLSRGQRWVVIGNYVDGRVYNGRVQIVPARASDWSYFQQRQQVEGAP